MAPEAIVMVVMAMAVEDDDLAAEEGGTEAPANPVTGILA